MVTDLTTGNRNYPLPHSDNSLAHDVNRLVAAIQALDGDVSTALAIGAALAPLVDPVFSGTPEAPTPVVGNNSSQIATTAFVQAAIAELAGSAPGALDTINELAAALGDDPNFAATITAQLAPLLAGGRLGGASAKTITDWNDAIENGFYMGQDAANDPISTSGITGWCIGTVIAHSPLWVTQKVAYFAVDNDANSRVYKRDLNNGVWSAWVKVMETRTELDARYLRQSNKSAVGYLTNYVGQEDTVAGRDSNGDIGGVRYLGAWSLHLHKPQEERNADDEFLTGSGGFFYRNTQAGLRTSLDVYSKAEVDALGGGMSAPDAEVRYEVGPSVHGGTKNSNVWETRPLNLTIDPQAIVTSLASNQLTLSVPCFAMFTFQQHCNYHQRIRVWNHTDAVMHWEDVSRYAHTADELQGMVELPAGKALSFDHYSVGSQSAYGMGIKADNNGGTFQNVNSVHASIKLWKL